MYYTSTLAIFLAAGGLLTSAAPAISPGDLFPRADVALLAVDDSGKLVNYGAGGKPVPTGNDAKPTNGTSKADPKAKPGDKKDEKKGAKPASPAKDKPNTPSSKPQPNAQKPKPAAGGKPAAKPAAAKPGAPKPAVGQGKQKRGPASTCVPLTKEDLQKLPAWKTIEAKAKQNWGNGKYNLVLNPKEYADRPALICMGKQKAVIPIKGKPDCTSSSQTSDGKLVGTSGSVKLTQQDGTSASTTVTVTKQSTIGTATTMGVEMGLEGFGKATFQQSFHVDITNTLANAKTTQSSNMKSHEITMEAPKGKSCHMEYTSTSCTGKGEGVVDYIAQGYVWFNFHSKTKGHYKWAMKIEDAVTKVSDRSSQMAFQATVKSTTNTQWNGKCK